MCKAPSLAQTPIGSAPTRPFKSDVCFLAPFTVAANIPSKIAAEAPVSMYKGFSFKLNRSINCLQSSIVDTDVPPTPTDAPTCTS